ncbi:MAG TPA: VOC family protein [Gemmatimonadaceae bacterium]|nr:VOC family protein [Gemmatimonadaceae bacterium]
MPTEPKGRFVWYDLMTTDQEKAIDFYSEVVGWTTEDFPGAPTRYAMWKSPEGANVGGSTQLPADVVQKGVPPHWIGYIATPNVDNTVQEAVKLGAKVLVQPADIPTVGRYAVLEDPQGATFAVFTAAGDTPGREEGPHVGEASWHELYTTDYKAAFDFYQKLFGWEKDQAMDMGDMGVYQMFSRNGQMLGGMMNKPDPNMPSAWTYYFRVPDINDAASRVTKKGGKILTGPMEVPGGDMIVMGADPQGGTFALHEKRS